MIATGIRDLKNNLSRYIRRIEEAGERIIVTDHGRTVAELVPPADATRERRQSHREELITRGILRPALEAGDPLADWPVIRLPSGTAAVLIDEDRDA